MGSSQYAQRGPQIEPLLCRESSFRPAEHWEESIRDLEGSCLGIFTLVPEPYRKTGLEFAQDSRFCSVTSTLSSTCAPS
ncbi:hypothetical protein VTO73DRAFT_681 [Trametes versicolor]